MIERCYCAACRIGDALPERLQGWPGAYQLNLLKAEPRMKIMPMTQDAAAREVCANRCVPDPPCWELDMRDGVDFDLCDACKRDLGIEVTEPLDPAAVTAPLL